MKKIAFRFDVDTHKCIREGVPNLIELSKEFGVPFTFFLNAGRAVSLKESLFCRNGSQSDKEENIKMMSARTKLGTMDYCIAAIINPPIYKYKTQIKMLLDSDCEVGLHGGRNHALWQYCAMNWNKDKTEDEIIWGLEKIRKTIKGFRPKGFASPTFNIPKKLDVILKEMGFQYQADYLHWMGNCIDMDSGVIPQVGINLYGNPGGVAFFENCRCRGLTDDLILMEIKDCISKNEVTVLYDHPYYAGIKELDLISKLILEMRSIGVEIVRLEDLI